MNKITRKNTADSVNTVSSMLLFLLVAACMLLMIGVAAGAYTRISENYRRTFDASASLRYITNKIKSAETVQAAENGFLIRSGGATNIIYYWDGGLYEKTVIDGDDISFEGGELIFKLDSMRVTENPELYRITVVVGGEKTGALVAKNPDRA